MLHKGIGSTKPDLAVPDLIESVEHLLGSVERLGEPPKGAHVRRPAHRLIEFKLVGC